MTVVALADNRPGMFSTQALDAASLRVRLAGRWAILFSHPDDFTQEQLEMDRWITVLARSFGARDLVPVALARPGSESDQGWLGQLAAFNGGSAAALALDASLGAMGDFAAGALRAQIARSGPRFAMILDSSLRCRRTLNYRLRTDLPSPLELIGWAVALRRRDHDEESSRETPGLSLPIRLEWMSKTRCRCAHAGRG